MWHKDSLPLGRMGSMWSDEASQGITVTVTLEWHAVLRGTQQDVSYQGYLWNAISAQLTPRACKTR